jgi:glycerol uptake facilitator-like aquaporin
MFVFLFATTLSVTYSGGKLINISTCYGITLAVVIFITGPVSGGHINPAVTFALALHRAIRPKQALFYIVAQLLGAICGVATAYGIADELIGSIFVNEKVSVTAGFFGEAVGTWFLVMTVFATAIHPNEGRATPEKQALGSLAPMVIGWSKKAAPLKKLANVAIGVWAMHFALVGVTGCGINPARYIGTALVLVRPRRLSLRRTDPSAQNQWSGHEWMYIFAPMFGALIAFPTQKMIYKPDPDDNLDGVVAAADIIHS